MTKKKAKQPVSNVPITQRQLQIFNFIVKIFSKHGYPPTVREIGLGMKISSPNGVMCHLRALEQKGYISRDESRSRGMRLLKADKCPCCGQPFPNPAKS